MLVLASKVLAFGASAGGVQALQRLLPAFSGATRAAAIVILHMHPHCRVPLNEIYGASSDLVMQEAEEKEPLLAGRVYFAPPGYHLLVERDRSLSLSVDGLVNWARPSIDVTLNCLARVFKSQVTAILLTGANSDGAQGCRAVQQAGGRVIVQDPGEAEVDSMPKAALQACQPDYIATLAEIGALMRGWIEGDLL